MFKILGADGREYGPVDAGQMREWIRQGRVGASTQTQPVGASQWTSLSALPEFAEHFAVKLPNVSEAPGSLPVVRTIAFATFVVAAISALWLVVGLISILRYASNGSFHPGFLYYFGWAVGGISLPLRIIGGIGLLRGREWARRLAIWLALVLALYGVWGLVQTGMMFARMPDVSYVLRSPMFLLSHLWSLAVFAFNIATVVLLSRKDVRGAFAGKSPPVV